MNVRSFITPVIFGLLAQFAGAAGLAVTTVHVDASAPTPGNGSAANPFSSPGGALKALANRTPAQREHPLIVMVHKGTYVLTESLAVTAASAGSAKAPVLWKAAGDGEVVFTGGIRIPESALRSVNDPETLARLPAERDASLGLFEIRLADIGVKEFPELESRGMRYMYETSWPELFQGGKPLPLSGWPNGEGYAKGFKPTKIISSGTTAKVTSGGASSTENKDQGTPMVFAFDNERTLRWKKAIDNYHASVWFGGHWYWDWADDFLPAAGISDDKAITMAKRHHYGMGPHINLHVYNLAEEMDQAGEYALEPAQKRILILLSKDAARSGLTLTWLGSPLLTLGKCSNVRFEGIRFMHGRSDGARVTGGTDIIFSHCSFSELGRNGVGVEGERVAIEDCDFNRIGATGASLEGGDRKTLNPGGNRVTHCEFHDFGRLKRTYAPGVSLGGVGNTVENSLLEGSPHAAILFGGNEHNIRNNEIRDVLTETGDCGAIYGGRDWTAFGTVISGNWLHDLKGAPGRWPSGIYLDDAISGITVKGNLVESLPQGLGVLVGGGRYNVIEDNIFSNCKDGMFLDSRGIRWMGLDIVKKRLAEMPVTKEPWASRYPMLKDTLKDSPGKPIGTRITGNAVVDCKAVWKAKDTGGDAAVVAPNWENDKGTKLSEQDGRVTVAGTPIVFNKPSVGVRK